MLMVGIVLLAAAGGVIYYSVSSHIPAYRALYVILLLAAIFVLRGLFIVNPNEAKVVTVRQLCRDGAEKRVLLGQSLFRQEKI